MFTVLWGALGSPSLILVFLFVAGVGTGTWSLFGPMMSEVFPDSRAGLGDVDHHELDPRRAVRRAVDHRRGHSNLGNERRHRSGGGFRVARGGVGLDPSGDSGATDRGMKGRGRYARAAVRRRRCRPCALLLGLSVLSGCGMRLPQAPPSRPALSSESIAALIPTVVADREGWANDVLAALAAIDRPADARAVCAVLAVIEQESGFRENPTVPNLGAILEREMEKRAREVAGVLGPPAVRALLSAKDSGHSASFGERFRRARTERDVDRIFRDMVRYYRREYPTASVLAGGASRLLAGRGLQALNPITTAGSMQVSVRFAMQRSRASGMSEEDVREFLYTRAGGVRFGTARLLDYEVAYDRMLYRFADFNAGYYASRNAAFQEQLARLSGRKLALDGDLLFYDDEGQALDRPSATLGAAVEVATARGWGLSAAEIRRQFEDEKRAISRTRRSLRRVRRATELAGVEVRPARLPELATAQPQVLPGPDDGVVRRGGRSALSAMLVVAPAA